MLTHNIHKVFTEILDVYHDADYYLRFFDAEKNIDISLILQDNEFRLTLFYHVVWYHLLKTYPTKKDTNNFINKLPPGDFLADYSDDFLQILMNNVIAIKNNKVDEDLKRKCKDLKKNFDDETFITELINDKLRYRYKNSSESDKKNMILMAIDIISSGDGSDGDLDAVPIDVNVITKNRVFNITWSEQDEMWMTPFEKRQYVICKDLHFILKLINYPSIYLPSSTDLVSTIMNAVNNNIIVFSHTKIENTCFNYILPNKRYYDCIPSISAMFFHVSHNLYPTVKSLSSITSIYHLRTPFVTNTLDLDIIQGYDKYIKNTIELLPETVPLRVYTILDPVVQKPIDYHNNYKFKVYNMPSLTTPLPYKNLESTDDLNNADIAIDQDALQCLRNGTIPILYKESPYVRTMINGVVTGDLNKTLQNLDDNIEITKILKKGIACFQRYLISRETYQCMWDYHVKYICPFRTLKTQHGILIYLDFVYSYFIKQLDSIMNLNAVNVTASNTVILVDNRPNILSVLSILFTLVNLNDTWTCNIVTSTKARDYYADLLGDLVTIHTAPEFSNCVKFDIDLYNDILKSERFWDKFSDYEKCLIVQDDGVLLRKGIENFLHFDYIGAPWVDVNENEYIKNNINRELVGNGGFSLRTISLMKKICKECVDEKNWLFFHNLNNIPEDVYFVKCVIDKGGKMPIFKLATTFASEEVLCDASLGFHKVWAYHHPYRVEQFFKRF